MACCRLNKKKNNRIYWGGGGGLFVNRLAAECQGVFLYISDIFQTTHSPPLSLGVIKMGKTEVSTPPSHKKLKQARLPFAPVNKQGENGVTRSWCCGSRSDFYFDADPDPTSDSSFKAMRICNLWPTDNRQFQG
jgi:hypothetical protein